MEKIDLLQAARNEYFNNIRINGRISSILEGKNTNFRNYWLKVKNREGNLEEFRLYMPIQDISGVNYELGDFVSVNGKIYSYQVTKRDGGKRLILSLFSKEVQRITKEQCETKTENEGVFVGYICKRPFIKYKDGLAITESTLSYIDNERNKYAQIPFIVSGENALLLKNKSMLGDRVAIRGFFQERTFPKQMDSGRIIERKANEVVASELEILK